MLAAVDSPAELQQYCPVSVVLYLLVALKLIRYLMVPYYIGFGDSRVCLTAANGTAELLRFNDPAVTGWLETSCQIWLHKAVEASED